MKRLLTLTLAFCLLIGISTFNTAATCGISDNFTKVLSENATYKVATDSSGEICMIDSNGFSINQLDVNVDQVINIDAYNDEESNVLFGVEITKIEALFPEEWIDAIIEKIGYKFVYRITLPYDCDIESAKETLAFSQHVLAISQPTLIDLEDNAYDAVTAATGHYDLIGVSTAWAKGFVGSYNVSVAVIDRGAKNHSEFDNNMFFDLGFNAAYESGVSGTGTSAEDVTPLNGNAHGHFVAGVIGADYGDGGINGICKNVTMIPILVDSTESRYEAFYYAILMGVDIINYSQVTMTSNMVNLIAGSDVLVVTSAGNNSQLLSSTNGKSNNLNNFIVVGNSNLNDTKYSDSNYSQIYVDLFAPGVGVPTANLTGTTSETGTSMSAPMVAAAAALVMSHATHLSAAEVRDLILDNVDTSSGLTSYCATGGRLAIDKVVSALYAENRGAYSKGDVTGDGYIDSLDITIAQRIANGTFTASAAQRSAADVNKNGTVTSADVEQIRKFYNETAYFPPI